MTVQILTTVEPWFPFHSHKSEKNSDPGLRLLRKKSESSFSDLRQIKDQKNDEEVRGEESYICVDSLTYEGGVAESPKKLRLGVILYVKGTK